MSGWASRRSRVGGVHAAIVEVGTRSGWEDRRLEWTRSTACACWACSGVAVCPCRWPRPAHTPPRFADAMPVGVDHGGQLALDDLLGLAHFTLGQGLADADDRRDAAGERRLGLSATSASVRLVMAALGMAHDGVAHAELLEHGGGNFAGVGAVAWGRDVLRAPALRAGTEPRHLHCAGRRGDADRHQAPRVALRAAHQLAHQRVRHGQVAVHLPSCPRSSFLVIAACLVGHHARTVFADVLGSTPSAHQPSPLSAAATCCGSPALSRRRPARQPSARSACAIVA